METTIISVIAILSLFGWLVNRLLFRKRLDRLWSEASAQVQEAERRRKTVAGQLHAAEVRLEQSEERRLRERAGFSEAAQELHDELDRRAEHIATLQGQCESAIDAVRDARARYVETHRQHVHRDQEMQGQLKELREELAIAEVRVEDTEAVLSAEREQEQQLATELKMVREELAELRRKEEVREEAFLELHCAHTALNDQLEERERAFSELRRLHGTETLALAERLEECDDRIADLSSALSAAERDAAASAGRHAAEMSAQAELRTALETRIAEYEARVSTLESERGRELEAVQAALNEQDIAVQALRSDRQATEKELQELSAALRERDTKIEELSWQHALQIDSLKRMVEELTGELEEQSAVLSEREGTIGELHDRTERLSQLVCERDGRIEELESSLVSADVEEAVAAPVAEAVLEPAVSASSFAALDIAEEAGESSARLAVAEDHDEVDDLKTIPGIGKATEASLNALGIRTFRHLAELEGMAMDTYAARFKSRFERGDWGAKARAMYREKYGKELASDKQLAIAGE